MSFESPNLNSNEQVPGWESPEEIQKKIEESVNIIMSEEEMDETVKMGIAEKIAATFKEDAGQRLMERVAEEIEKSKRKEGRMGHMKKIEDEWRKGLDKAA